MSLLLSPMFLNSFESSSYSSQLPVCDSEQILVNIFCNINCVNEYELTSSYPLRNNPCCIKASLIFSPSELVKDLFFIKKRLSI